MFDLIVSSASGIEGVTKKHLERMGYSDLRAVRGRIEVRGGFYDIASLNINLRTAERVLIKACEFAATTFDELYDGLKGVKWRDYFEADSAINVSAKCLDSVIMSARSCQSITKKAIADSLCRAYGVNTLSESGVSYDVEVKMFNNTATVCIDTTGEGLHKRGYRDLSAPAPLKETLAAAIVELAGWDYRDPFYDLFCGSGTLPIEAALTARNIPAGINRNFAFNSWQSFPSDVFTQAKEDALAKVKSDLPLKIFGSDIDADMVSISRRHAKRAGVGLVDFTVADAREFVSDFKKGVIVANVPYGERLSDSRDTDALYKSFGKAVSKLSGWKCLVLATTNNLERIIGLRATKKRPLYNGKIECTLYTFVIN